MIFFYDGMFLHRSDVMRNVYIKNHFFRFVRVLNDKEYQRVMNITKEQAKDEVRQLWILRKKIVNMTR